MWVRLGQSSTLSGNEAACPVPARPPDPQGRESGQNERVFLFAPVRALVIWDIFISLNSSYQDEDAGVFKFSVA